MKLREKILRVVIPRMLRQLAQQIEDNKYPCNVTDAEILDIFVDIQDSPVSKEEACGRMHISRATFDNRVLLGIYPPARHSRGFRQNYWYIKELEACNSKYLKN